MSLLRAREAIATVAASHEPDCSCTTCRAAAGDEDALMEVLRAVADVDLADELAQVRARRQHGAAAAGSEAT